MDGGTDLYTYRILKDFGLNVDAVIGHVLPPPRDGAQNATQARTADPAPLPRKAGPAFLYRFNARKFAKKLQATLGASDVGYAVTVRRNGRTILEQRHDRTAISPHGASGRADSAMHLAGTGNLLTAIALAKLLAEQEIPLDSGIDAWLPAYWSRGAGIDRITFRQLLTHTSGLAMDGGACDFAFLKQQIAIGTRHPGAPAHRNIDFGLCRILVATLTRTIATQARCVLFGTDHTDQFWDLVSIAAYERYVRDAILAPARVSATLDQPADGEPAQRFGGLRAGSGAIGWHMSPDALLGVMGTFRRGHAGISATQAQSVLDQGLGIDRVRETKLGRCYATEDYRASDRGVEQSIAYFLPGGIEMVLLAQSGASGAEGFQTSVATLVEECIDPIVPVGIATAAR